jgi:hypothetical protein
MLERPLAQADRLRFLVLDNGGCALRGDVLLLAVMSFFGKWNWHDPVSITRRSRGLYGKEDAA